MFVVLLTTVGVWREIDRDVGQTVVVPGFDVQLTDNDRAAATLLSGDDWVLEQPSGTSGVPCARLRIGDRATSCLSLEYVDGSYGVSVVRSPGGGAFVQVFGDPSSTVRLYSSGRTAQVHDAVVVDLAGSEVGIVVVELAPGEEPFGLQVFDADGDLVSVTTLLDSLG